MKRHFTRKNRGMTFVEMSIAIVILSMISLAVASFSLAVGQSWKDSESRQLVQLSSQQGRALLGKMVQSSRGSFYVTNGGRTVFFWQYDGLTGDADGNVNFGEMAVLEYNATLQSIIYYQPVKYDTMSGIQQAKALQVLSESDQQSDAVVEMFKGSDWLNTPRPIIGRASAVASTLETTRVLSCQFTVSRGAAGRVPGLNMTTTIQRAGLQVTAQDFFPVIAPTTAPSW